MTEWHWTNERIFSLIEEYKNQPALWDSNNDCYRIHSKKIEAWNRIAENLNLDVMEIKRKMGSLLASYRRERLKIQNMKKLGISGSELTSYRQNCWFAYPSFDFLNKKNNIKTEKEEINDFQEMDRDSNIEFVTVENPNENCNEDDEVDNEQMENFTIPQPRLRENLTQKTRNKNKKLIIKDNENFEYVKYVHSKKRDLFDAYGEYISAKLRSLDTFSCIYVQKAISDIIFEADLGKFKTMDVEESPHN